MSTEAAIKQAARSARRSVARIARADPSVFNEFVLRDERNGQRIKLAPMHIKWHELITAHPRLVFWSHVDAGKSSNVSIGRVLWELGKNPNMRIAILSKTNELAMKIVRTLGQYLEKSSEIREVFPNLLPSNDPSLPWTSHALTVVRSIHARDPSVQACGNFGNIQGARLDLVIIDDILDFENTRSVAIRDHLWGWFRGMVYGRLSEGGRVVAMGNAFHPDDVLHKLEKEPRYFGFRFPVMDKKGRLSWPDHWSHKRIQEAREDMGALEFARQLLCQARDDETSIIKREWVEACKARGQGRGLYPNAASFLKDNLTDEKDLDALAAYELAGEIDADGKKILPLGTSSFGFRFYTGVDLGVQRHAKSDLSCLFTIAAHPDGRRQVLWIESGRWTAPDILKRVGETYRRFGSIFVIENVAAQDYLVQLLREPGSPWAALTVPVIPFTTGRQKAHEEFGIQGLGAELEGKRWIIPCGQDGKLRSSELDAWIVELISFDKNAHSGDRLMASWFAREGARRTDPRHPAHEGNVGVRILGDSDEADD